MQKWHIHSAIHRGRPVLLEPRSTFIILSSRNYFHTTSPRAQEYSKQQNFQDPPKPLSRRAKLLQKATYSTENLYRRSAEPVNLGSGNGESIFRYQRREGIAIERSAVLAPQHTGGVPLSKDVIDGTHDFGSSDGGGYRVVRGRTLSFFRYRRSTDPQGDRQAVDARSLGANSQGSQGSPIVGKVRRNVLPDETRGLSGRSPYQSRESRGDNDVQEFRPEERRYVQQRPLGRENAFQQSFPSMASMNYSDTQGAENDGQGFRANFARGQTGSKPPNRRDAGRSPQSGRSHGSRSRAPHDSDGSDRRRTRDAKRSSDGVEGRGRNRENWTEEEQDYLKEKEERKSQKPLGYEPVVFSKEEFAKMAPATASDEWGMGELLGERRPKREFLQWDSKELEFARLKVVRGSLEGASSAGDGDRQTQSLMQKLLAGEYAKFKWPGENDVLGHVERHVHRNDSFYPDDEKSLLEKVRSILPAKQSSNIRKGARKAVEA